MEEGSLAGGDALKSHETNEDHVSTDGETCSMVYVPPLQLTEGQPPPMAANGGLSYMSFDRDGDAGTSAAIEAALNQISEGHVKAFSDWIESAPPGPIETKWGFAFREYEECLDYIRANNIEVPKGGLALPLRYTAYEQPAYSIVPSNSLWQDPAREAEAKLLYEAEEHSRSRSLYFPQVVRDGRRIWDYYPGLSVNSPRMYGQAWRFAGLPRVQLQELLRLGGSGTCVLPGDREAPAVVLPRCDRCARLQPRRL